MTRTLGTLVWQAANDGANRIAVVDRDASLTYGELDALVCGYASALRNAGVAAGDVVAIHLDKSARAVAAIHAVLRLGAAYVPLDPKTPVPRLELIVGDARPAAVVVERRTAKVWRDTTIGAPPFVDSDGVVPSAVRIDPAVVDADALAYVLYTSGSTGTPKGVELTHANALAFVDWAVSAFAVGDGDRLASHAPFHFDLSIFDLYAAASTGASVALVPRAVTRFPVELSKWITDNHVTIWYSVPTALTLLVTHGNVHTADLSSLRVVLFAGEVFPVRHLAALMEAVPDPAYWNLYGPTETNVCTAYRVDERPDPDGEPVPIGWAVAGDRATVVDEDGAPVAAGTTGELVIHGPTVARGYRDRSIDAQQRFLPDQGAGRGYRSGDRVVDRGDGCFVFVGRVDAQVKTRGYRVELGEIEVALLRDPAVGDGAVVAVPDDVVTNKLFAFVEPSPGTAPTPKDVLDHLGAQLPPSMLPDVVRVVAVLPRTTTGKIDRVALLARATDG